MQAYIHTYIHTYTHTHIHTGTQPSIPIDMPCHDMTELASEGLPRAVFTWTSAPHPSTAFQTVEKQGCMGKPQPSERIFVLAGSVGKEVYSRPGEPWLGKVAWPSELWPSQPVALSSRSRLFAAVPSKPCVHAEYVSILARQNTPGKPWLQALLVARLKSFSATLCHTSFGSSTLWLYALSCRSPMRSLSLNWPGEK